MEGAGGNDPFFDFQSAAPLFGVYEALGKSSTKPLDQEAPNNARKFSIDDIPGFLGAPNNMSPLRTMLAPPLNHDGALDHLVPVMAAAAERSTSYGDDESLHAARGAALPAAATVSDWHRVQLGGAAGGPEMHQAWQHGGSLHLPAPPPHEHPFGSYPLQQQRNYPPYPPPPATAHQPYAHAAYPQQQQQQQQHGTMNAAPFEHHKYGGPMQADPRGKPRGRPRGRGRGRIATASRGRASRAGAYDGDEGSYAELGPPLPPSAIAYLMDTGYGGHAAAEDDEDAATEAQQSLGRTEHNAAIAPGGAGYGKGKGGHLEFAALLGASESALQSADRSGGVSGERRLLQQQQQVAPFADIGYQGGGGMRSAAQPPPYHLLATQATAVAQQYAAPSVMHAGQFGQFAPARGGRGGGVASGGGARGGRQMAMGPYDGPSALDDDPAAPASFDMPRKRRFLWTELLHRRFIAAIFDLGVSTSTPKLLAEALSESCGSDGLSSDHIKSHLQKFRVNSRPSRDDFLRDYDRAFAEARARAAAETQRSGVAPFPVTFSTYPLAMPADQQAFPPRLPAPPAGGGSAAAGHGAAGHGGGRGARRGGGAAAPPPPARGGGGPAYHEFDGPSAALAATDNGVRSGPCDRCAELHALMRMGVGVVLPSEADSRPALHDTTTAEASPGDSARAALPASGSDGDGYAQLLKDLAAAGVLPLLRTALGQLQQQQSNGLAGSLSCGPHVVLKAALALTAPSAAAAAAPPVESAVAASVSNDASGSPAAVIRAGSTTATVIPSAAHSGSSLGTGVVPLPLVSLPDTQMQSHQLPVHWQAGLSSAPSSSELPQPVPAGPAQLPTIAQRAALPAAWIAPVRGGGAAATAATAATATAAAAAAAIATTVAATATATAAANTITAAGRATGAVVVGPGAAAPTDHMTVGSGVGIGVAGDAAASSHGLMESHMRVHRAMMFRQGDQMLAYAGQPVTAHHPAPVHAPAAAPARTVTAPAAAASTTAVPGAASSSPLRAVSNSILERGGSYPVPVAVAADIPSQRAVAPHASIASSPPAPEASPSATTFKLQTRRGVAVSLSLPFTRDSVLQFTAGLMRAAGVGEAGAAAAAPAEVEFVPRDGISGESLGPFGAADVFPTTPTKLFDFLRVKRP